MADKKVTPVVDETPSTPTLALVGSVKVGEETFDYKLSKEPGKFDYILIYSNPNKKSQHSIGAVTIMDESKAQEVITKYIQTFIDDMPKAFDGEDAWSKKTYEVADPYKRA